MARAALRVKSKIWLESDGRLIFSDGRLQLLEAVEELGSLRQAASRLNMSYRAAWGLLKVTERALGTSLLRVRIGGAAGGGATLTPAAQDLVRRFRRLKSVVNGAADRSFAAHCRGRRPGPRTADRRPRAPGLRRPGG
jgi:molybdate transport system regulatory protein